VEITAQRRNTEDRRRINRSSGVVTHSKFQSSANANNLSYTRLDAFQHFFHRMRPLADTEGRRLTRRTPEVADVPLGDATYVCCFPDSFESARLTASIASATMLLVRKTGYDRTRSSSASAGSRRSRIHRDNSMTST
jgi:hypothetical protein